MPIIPTGVGLALGSIKPEILTAWLEKVCLLLLLEMENLRPSWGEFPGSPVVNIPSSHCQEP